MKANQRSQASGELAQRNLAWRMNRQLAGENRRASAWQAAASAA